MTARKQKHLAALKKREEFLAAERELGLKGLRASKAARARDELREWEDNHNKNHTNSQKRIQECPHCRIIARASARNTTG